MGAGGRRLDIKRDNGYKDTVCECFCYATWRVAYLHMRYGIENCQKDRKRKVSGGGVWLGESRELRRLILELD